MEALVQKSGQLLRGVRGGEVWSADVAHKERISGEQDAGPLWFCPAEQALIGHQDTDALQRMAGRMKEAKVAGPEMKFIAVRDDYVREPCAGVRAQVNLCAGSFGQFVVPGDEVGMDVSLDDMPDLPALVCGCGQVNIHVTLRVNNDCHAAGPEHVGGMGQATQVEAFHVN